MNQPPSIDAKLDDVSTAEAPVRLPDPIATVAHVSLLLNQLDTPDEQSEVSSGEAAESRLIQARLGFGSSLFTALRMKHAPSATHSLRVALGCSSWAMGMGIQSPLLDEIEVAALLHDIGKIGVPDQVLLKTEQLTASETTMLVTYRAMGLEILKSFCASPSVLEIVRYAPRWYQPSGSTEGPTGEDLSLGARVLSIVDAFDSITSEQSYRAAKTRDEAMHVLREHAGTQFDPNLVRHFCKMQQRDQGQIHTEVALRWMHQVAPQAVPGIARPTPPEMPTSLSTLDTSDTLAPLFLEKLIGSMHDGVIFVDENLKIQFWNRGAQRLTGIAASDVDQKKWQPTMIGLKDEEGRALSDEACPVRQVMESSVQMMRRLEVTSRSGRAVPIDLHIVPVVCSDGSTHGANLLMRDVSSELSLEERVQTLHVKASRDPLTGVANRADFDQTHQAFIASHEQQGIPCSLIITDIDHFKKVNDTHGHQAGDEALKVFAQLLQRSCRPGDLVVRYGGEEFVLLCADCDLDGAVARAERLRRELENLRLEMLGGKHITASFGVTQSLPGDTDEAMLRRADIALLSAKEEGRNTVTATSPPQEMSERATESSWFGWPKAPRSKPVLDREIVTPVPLQVLVEQLRGFTMDSGADVKTIDKNRVELCVNTGLRSIFRRESDRPVAFLIDIQLIEEESNTSEGGPQGQIRTRMHVTIRPRRSRDRRRGDVADRAQVLYSYLQAYLMTSELDPDQPAAKPRATTLDGTWLALKH